MFNLVFNLGVAEYALNGFKTPPTAARTWPRWVFALACPLGPIPLAARGLAAVLARAARAGARHRHETSAAITVATPRLDLDQACFMLKVV